MFSSDCAYLCVCVCLCMCVHSKLVSQTIGALNANSSKLVKATLKFYICVSRFSPDISLKMYGNGGMIARVM